VSATLAEAEMRLNIPGTPVATISARVFVGGMLGRPLF